MRGSLLPVVLLLVSLAGGALAAELCLMPSETSGNIVTYDCSATPQNIFSEWVGFTTETVPCKSPSGALMCWHGGPSAPMVAGVISLGSPVGVRHGIEALSWGMVRRMYREE